MNLEARARAERTAMSREVAWIVPRVDIQQLRCFFCGRYSSLSCQTWFKSEHGAIVQVTFSLCRKHYRELIVLQHGICRRCETPFNIWRSKQFLGLMRLGWAGKFPKDCRRTVLLETIKGADQVT